MNSLAIIVLNWNGSDDTIECVKSLSISAAKFDIIVVDNGSTPEDLATLEPFLKEIPNVTLLKNSHNKGFAGGVNTGIRYALEHDIPHVALLNNDAVIDEHWVEELFTALQADESTSVVTGLLLSDSKETIDSTGEQYSTWGLPFPRSRGDAVAKAPSSGYVFGATGGATLYKTSLFKEIGLFDESLFAYYEDVDISFRAQLAGYKIYYTNQAIVYHKQGATSGKLPGFTVYQMFKNLPLVYIKNIPLGLLIPVGFRLFFAYWLMFLKAIKNGSGFPAFKGWLASIWYFWTQALWKRFAIQSRKKVSTKYIKSILWHDLPPNQPGMRKLRSFFIGK